EQHQAGWLHRTLHAGAQVGGEDACYSNFDWGRYSRKAAKDAGSLLTCGLLVNSERYCTVLGGRPGGSVNRRVVPEFPLARGARCNRGQRQHRGWSCLDPRRMSLDWATPALISISERQIDERAAVNFL